MVGDANSLDKFYERLGEGMQIAALFEMFDGMLVLVRSSQLLPEYRLGHKKMKVLKDEVSPAVRFARQTGLSRGIVRFSLDQQSHWDFEIKSSEGNVRRYEVTGALRRSQYFLVKELNEKGCGRGYLGFPDDAPKKCFEEEMLREFKAYSTDEALATMCSSVGERIETKARKRARGLGQKALVADTLLIEAPLNNLPIERWSQILPELGTHARRTSFDDVYLICDSERPDVGFSLLDRSAATSLTLR